MMNDIVLATNNAKKLHELQSLMTGLKLNFIPQAKFNIGISEEPHHTFIENALIKARYAAERTNLPAIADDSGICVDALAGKPGVLSARFAGEGAADAENNKKLLDCLQHEKNRKAHYHCAIVFVRNVNDPEPIICEGQWYGEILLAARGRNGFGYDPIFLDFKTEKSAAELAPEVKNRISHRGQALQKLKQKFRIIYA